MCLQVFFFAPPSWAGLEFRGTLRIAGTMACTQTFTSFSWNVFKHIVSAHRRATQSAPCVLVDSGLCCHPGYEANALPRRTCINQQDRRASGRPSFRFQTRYYCSCSLHAHRWHIRRDQLSRQTRATSLILKYENLRRICDKNGLEQRSHAASIHHLRVKNTL